MTLIGLPVFYNFDRSFNSPTVDDIKYVEMRTIRLSKTDFKRLKDHSWNL